MASVHRPTARRSTMIKKLALVACCLALAASAAHAQQGSGSGSGVTGVATTTPAPSKTTKAPTTKTPATTAPTPVETTAAPTETPAPTTEKPTATPAPEEEEATEAPVETPEPTTAATKTKKANATEEAVTVTPVPAVAETVMPASGSSAADDSSSTTTTTKPSSGAAYGNKDSSSSGSTNEVNTKDVGTQSSNVMTFVIVAVGVLALVLVAALSVFTIQRRRAREAEEEEEDQKYVPSRNASQKRPDLEMPPVTTTAAVPVSYDNFATPQHAAGGYPDIRDEKKAAMGGQWKQPTANAYRDSEEMFDAPLSKPVSKSEWSGNYTAAAAVGAGVAVGAGAAATMEFSGDDDDMVEFSTYTQPMEPRITKFRGKSEESNMDDEDYSQYSNNLMDSSANNKLNMSASEVDLDSLVEVNPAPTSAAAIPASTTSLEFEFDQFFNAPGQENDVDVDDVDVDDEDIDGGDVDIDDDGGARFSLASSVGEFHDSTVDRPSELDAEEFEV